MAQGVVVHNVMLAEAGVDGAEESVDRRFQRFRADRWQPHNAHAVMFRDPTMA